MSDFFVSLSLADQPCLLAGDSVRGLAAARGMLAAGAVLHLLNTGETPFPADIQQACRRYRSGSFSATDLEGICLVVEATAGTGGQKRIREAAASANLMFAEVTADGTLRMDPGAPREPNLRLGGLLPVGGQRFQRFVRQQSPKIRSLIPDPQERKAFWRRMVGGVVGDLVAMGRAKGAGPLLSRWLGSGELSSNPVGEVVLVGAGPGDPELLTCRALRIIRQADIVVYDRLVSDEILALVNPQARRLYVGKARKQHALPQAEINRTLVDLASQGLRVVRLKGGDPFIFGRGGEEIDQLAAAGIPFTVVPGITAASGCAAYSGIPLTHREYSQSVRFVTGHLKDDSCNLPWPDLVQDQQTIVFYMGLIGLPLICQQLMHHGMSASMPVAIVSRGTTPAQRVLVGTLATIADAARRSAIEAPTIIIVGEVVRLREKLNWLSG